MNLLFVALLSVSFAQQQHDIRLVGGNSEKEGRIEVYKDGEWGTICDKDFMFEAEIYCKSLGYISGWATPQFGGGTGLVAYGKFFCKGDEESIWDCWYDNHYIDPTCASHSHDIGVICYDQTKADSFVHEPCTDADEVISEIMEYCGDDHLDTCELLIADGKKNFWWVIGALGDKTGTGCELEVKTTFTKLERNKIARAHSWATVETIFDSFGLQHDVYLKDLCQASCNVCKPSAEPSTSPSTQPTHSEPTPYPSLKPSWGPSTEPTLAPSKSPPEVIPGWIDKFIFHVMTPSIGGLWLFVMLYLYWAYGFHKKLFWAETKLYAFFILGSVDFCSDILLVVYIASEGLLQENDLEIISILQLGILSIVFPLVYNFISFLCFVHCLCRHDKTTKNQVSFKRWAKHGDSRLRLTVIPMMVGWYPSYINPLRSDIFHGPCPIPLHVIHSFDWHKLPTIIVGDLPQIYISYLLLQYEPDLFIALLSLVASMLNIIVLIIIVLVKVCCLLPGLCCNSDDEQEDTITFRSSTKHVHIQQIHKIVETHLSELYEISPIAVMRQTNLTKYKYVVEYLDPISTGEFQELLAGKKQLIERDLVEKNEDNAEPCLGSCFRSRPVVVDRTQLLVDQHDEDQQGEQQPAIAAVDSDQEAGVVDDAVIVAEPALDIDAQSHSIRLHSVTESGSSQAKQSASVVQSDPEDSRILSITRTVEGYPDSNMESSFEAFNIDVPDATAV